MIRPWNQAARTLLRRPGFTISAVLILGAGIGATTGVFSVVDTAVLQPLPYPDPDRLVTVMEANTAKSEAASLIAPARVEDWNQRSRSFVAIAGSYSENVTETSGDVPERLSAIRMTPRYFAVYGVRAEVGRTPAPEEEAYGGPTSVVISDRLWARRFQHAADVTSQHLILDGKPYRIVGVMPASFSAGRDIDLWMPAQLAPGLMHARDARFLSGVGRLRRGVSVDAAQRDLVRVQSELGREFPASDRNWSAQVTDLARARTGDLREPLLFILMAVGLLLLIALANTAGLMLTQLQRREHELAIRGLLGATRVQVVFAVVQEVLILAAVAIALAIVGDAVFLRFARASLTSLPRSSDLAIDWRALAVASLCGLGAALACGALPAWRATRRGIAATVSRIGRGTSADSRSQRALVGGQIAVATLLLCSTALMLRSYYNLTHEDPGFDAAHSVTFHVSAAWEEDRAAVGRMQMDLLRAFGNIPGVTAAGFTNFLPAANATLRFQVDLPGTTAAKSNGSDHLNVGERSVTSGYFQALGARMVAGAACPDLAVVPNSAPKMLVNRRFMEEYAGGRSPVGRLVHWTQDTPNTPASVIVGVVDDVREDNLRTAAVPYAYQCIAPGSWPDPEYVVRTRGDPRALLPAIRAAVHRVAPTRAVFGLQTLQDDLNETLGQTRLQTTLIAAFGLAAAGLAIIGLYGLVALAVTTRQREIGIRIALGAAPGRVVRELAARIGWLLAAGAAGGILLTIAAQRELRSLVFGVAALDPATLGAAVLVLGIAAAVAALVPALRAARIDPSSAMRDGG
jgi:putative ABC transport system permease protein